MVLIDKFLSLILSFYEGYFLKNCEFAIVSNNCWGYKIYQSTKKQYNTPFVGLFLYPECYLKVCADLERYLSIPLCKINYNSTYIQDETSYPVGHIGDVEIHFLHYHNPDECVDKWNKRSKRLLKHIKLKNRVLFQFNDRDFATKEQLKQFHELLIDKSRVSFGREYIDSSNHFKVKKEDLDGNKVVDGVRLYDSRYRYISLVKILKRSES
ncbi:DUF1919 domain-containing protein [Vibrio metschnikovii]|nr:DUF1919 domain-containing protein [Vibrio metschnikovii]